MAYTVHISESVTPGRFRLGYFGPTKLSENDRLVELNNPQVGANPTHANQRWQSLHPCVASYPDEPAAVLGKKAYRGKLVSAGAVFDGESVFSFPKLSGQKQSIDKIAEILLLDK